MTANHHPPPPPTNPTPTNHVTAGEIAKFLRDLTRTHPPAPDSDPANHAALLARKADLLTRIANQHDTLTNPEQARHIAEHARTQAATAARHAKNPKTDDTTNVKDLPSPTSPRQGIPLSNTAEFRRASSPLRDKLADATGYPLPAPAVLRQANTSPCAISVPLRAVNHGQQRSPVTRPDRRSRRLAAR